MWDFEKVDTADSTDDSGIYEMEPMNEMKVGSNVQLHSVVKSVNPEEPTMWYAQVCQSTCIISIQSHISPVNKIY